MGIINYGGQEQEVERGFKFLYVGRLSPEKNLDTLIKVFNSLPHHLSIVGEGPEYSKLQSISNNNIHFHGYVNNEELATYYRSCRALVLISKDEPYGLVAEEALFFGTPAIVSSVCGIVDTLCFHQKNSLVVEATDREAIGKAVELIMDNKVYASLKKDCNSQKIMSKNEKQVKFYTDYIRGK